MNGILKSMNISASSLGAQRMRMNVLSSNLANAQTTRTAEGGPYKRQDVIFSASPIGNEFEDFLDDTFLTQLKQVKVVGIHADTKEPREVFDPHHVDADSNGYVKMPNIQVMSEMVNMIAATRAYEANATALNETKTMALKAIDIGRA